MTELTFDPLDPRHASEAPARLAQLRKTCPVAETAPGFVYVALDADARAAFRDYHSLSNANNFQLDDDSDIPPTIVSVDPPRHTQLRRLLLSAFTPRVVAQSHDYIKAVAHALVDAIEDEGRADLVDRYTGPLPARVIAHLVGVPEEDHQRFYRWTVDITARVPDSVLDLPSWHEFIAYLTVLVDERYASARSPDDLVTALISAEIDGARLEKHEIVSSVSQLIMAGNDTMNRLIANCVHQLLSRREMWDRVRADHALIPLALEESLRHDPPIQWAMRSCVQEMHIGDTTIAPGTRVLVGIASANRDEVAWAEPDTFALDRDHPTEHLAFGYGIHMCLGAPLARLEGPIALETLLTRLPELRLAPGFVYERTPSPMMHGPRRLDVTWA